MSFSKFKLGKRDTHEVDRTEDYYGDRKRYSSGQKNYFDGSDDEEEEGQMTSSVAMEAAKRSIGDYRMAKEGVVAAAEEEDDEDDPLDAFMAGIETQIKQEKSKPATTEPKAVREDIEGEDDQESYFNAVANAPLIILDEDDELQLEYDRDGNPIIPESARVIDPLPPIDHSEINYKSFEKNFYEEDEKVKNLTKQEVKDLRKKLGIRVSGFDPPNPCVSFAHFGFDNHLMALIRKSEFSTPTPIQSQSIPAALKGRDIIGIAQTGSGKTVSYLWPLMVHCVDQPELKEGDGPIALICTPTRELCQQVYHQAKKFAKAYNLSVCCVYGGGNRYEQSQALKEGCEILVATPGRLIDLVKLKATNLQRVTFLVMDEADRMFDLGFEPQVRSIANHVRPDRQTLLFSATFRKKIEKLCRDILTDPIRIVIGDLGEANTDITQTVKVFEDPKNKWVWLMNYLVSFVSAGSVLIFCTKKSNSEEVAHNLRQNGYSAGLLHGDMGQADRDEVITNFKKKSFPILVATDVAARGLDIPSIKTVVNYDVAKDIDTHVHRIGRTGRAGEKGAAHTLVMSKDVNMAGDLVRNLETADQVVPDELLQLAMKNPRFVKSRSKYNKSQKNVGGSVLGGGMGGANKRLRLGLGATKSASSSSNHPTLSSITSGCGPGGNRAAAVKEALQASYKFRFQAASSNQFSTTSSVAATTKDTPPQTKKRKSRWQD